MSANSKETNDTLTVDLEKLRKNNLAQLRELSFGIEQSFDFIHQLNTQKGLKENIYTNVEAIREQMKGVDLGKLTEDKKAELSNIIFGFFAWLTASTAKIFTICDRPATEGELELIKKRMQEEISFEEIAQRMNLYLEAYNFRFLELIQAIHEGSLEKVQKFLNENTTFSIDVLHKIGFKLLFLAIHLKKLNILKSLLEHLKKQYIGSELFEAASLNASFRIPTGVGNENTILVQAILTGDLNIVNILLEYGINPNFPFSYGLHMRSAVSIAFSLGFHDIAVQLIRYGARLGDVNEGGISAAVYAVIGNDPETLSLISNELQTRVIHRLERRKTALFRSNTNHKQCEENIKRCQSSQSAQSAQSSQNSQNIKNNKEETEKTCQDQDNSKTETEMLELAIDESGVNRQSKNPSDIFWNQYGMTRIEADILRQQNLKKYIEDKVVTPLYQRHRTQEPYQSLIACLNSAPRIAEGKRMPDGILSIIMQYEFCSHNPKLHLPLFEFHKKSISALSAAASSASTTAILKQNANAVAQNQTNQNNQNQVVSIPNVANTNFGLNQLQYRGALEKLIMDGPKIEKPEDKINNIIKYINELFLAYDKIVPKNESVCLHVLIASFKSIDLMIRNLNQDFKAVKKEVIDLIERQKNIFCDLININPDHQELSFKMQFLHARIYISINALEKACLSFQKIKFDLKSIKPISWMPDAKKEALKGEIDIMLGADFFSEKQAFDEKAIQAKLQQEPNLVKSLVTTGSSVLFGGYWDTITELWPQETEALLSDSPLPSMDKPSGPAS